MSYLASAISKDATLPILVLSQREQFVTSVIDTLAPDRVEQTSLSLLQSGRMQDQKGKAPRAPMVLLADSDPARDGYVEEIASLRELCGPDDLVIALIPSDTSFEQARRLRTGGADEVLPDTVSGDEIRDLVKQLIDARKPVAYAPGPRRKPGEIIAVAQARGGVGSTTLAVNLACGLVGGQGKRFRRKAAHKRVALVDLDLQFGNANVFFDLEDNGGMMQILNASAPPDDYLLKSVMQTHESGVDVLSAPMDFVPLHSAAPETVGALLTSLRNNYDYVIVDLPRAMVDWLQPVISDAALVVLATDTTVPCIRQAQRTIKFFREENVGLPVHVVVNREKRSLFKSEHVREAEKVLELQLNDWLPDSIGAARRAADLGRPVIFNHAKCDLGKAYKKVVASIEQAVLTTNEADA